MNAFLLALVAASIWGVVPLIEKLGMAKVADPLVGLFYRCLGVIIGLVLLSTMVLKPHQIRSIDARSAGMFVLAGFLASIVAQVAFYHGLKAGEISRVVPIAGSFPLITAALGILILGEAVVPTKIIGILLVIAGIWTLKF